MKHEIVRMQKETTLKILILEDNVSAAASMEDALEHAGIAFTARRVENHESFVEDIRDFQPDVILASVHLADYDGHQALAHVRKHCPQTPVVIVTRSLGDEAAIELLKAGAKDYVLKDNIKRLPFAVERALAEEAGIRARKAAEQALREREALFHSITSTAQDAIILIDDRGQLAYWNSAAAKMFGYSMQEMTGQDFHETVAPERFRAAYRQGFARFASTGEGSVIGKTLELAALRKDGKEFPIELSVAKVQLGQRWHAVGILRDITERKRIEAQLRQERDNAQRYLDIAGVVLVALDREGRITLINRKGCETLGYREEELLGKPWFDHLPETVRQEVHRTFLRLIAGEEDAIEYHENSVLHRDGSESIMAWHNRVLTDGDGQIVGTLSSGEDITLRKQAENALRDSEARLRAIFDSAEDGILVADTDTGRFLHCNTAICEMLGYSPKELLALAVQDIHPHDDLPYVQSQFESQAAGEISLARDIPVLRKDGSVFYADVNSSPLTLGQHRCLLGMFRDITERRESEAALQASRDLLELVIETVPIRVFWKDQGLRYLGSNSLFAQDLGLASPKELVGKTDTDLGRKDQTEAGGADEAEVMASGVPKMGYETAHTAPGRQTTWLRMSKVPLRANTDAAIGILGIYEDITEQKLAQISLQRANRALNALSACNSTLVHASSESQLLQDMCRVITDKGSYLLAWIGQVEHDEGRRVVPIARAGIDDSYVDSLNITWADNARGQGPTGRAVRTGVPQIAHNIPTDPSFQPWSEAATKRGFASSMALPLKQKDEVFATLNIYAAEPEAFDEAEVRLLKEMAEDLAFGILNLRTRVEHEQLQKASLQAIERTKQALTETILAIALTVEKRDPYTAGHQQRVAKLCEAIADEMALPEQAIEGLRLGALIHDIGKIYVPSEILNRPGKLSQVEFELIKTHSQVGFDIVKDVSFPWPVGEMILQHHEHLDGSGYPQGLKGEAIILEARILAVADAVEAIGSHRPYRPALGVDAALAEIEQQRGVKYDADVVDACLRVFREKGFRFE